MRNKVYFSIPVSIDWDTARKAFEPLEALYKVSYWKRDQSYDRSLLDNADAFVVVLPGFKWNSDICDLPIGVIRELALAKKLRKVIYLAYRPVASLTIQYYRTEYEDDHITGIAGSYAHIYSWLQSSELEARGKAYLGIPESGPTDRRLLLAL